MTHQEAIMWGVMFLNFGSIFLMLVPIVAEKIAWAAAVLALTGIVYVITGIWAILR